jgi:hypothetical protein
LGRIRIDIEICEWCAGQVKIIVEASNRCIEDPGMIERILAHLNGKAPSTEPRCFLMAVRHRHRLDTSIELKKSPINNVTVYCIGAVGLLLACGQESG